MIAELAETPTVLRPFDRYVTDALTARGFSLVRVTYRYERRRAGHGPARRRPGAGPGDSSARDDRD